MATIRVRRTTSDDPEFLTLERALTEFLAELNGEKNSYYAQHNKAASLSNAVVAYADEQRVGCGGFRPVEDGGVEIKRMFVSPEVRSGGIGGAILRELEEWARELGYSRSMLETSKRLGSAVRLYEKSGYSVIPNYGPYVGVGDSVCMERELPPSA
jgi:putative acetyltransferase